MYVSNVHVLLLYAYYMYYNAPGVRWFSAKYLYSVVLFLFLNETSTSISTWYVLTVTFDYYCMGGGGCALI